MAAQIKRLPQCHPWPGNVRELKNCIERSFLLTPNEADDLNSENLAITLEEDQQQNHQQLDSSEITTLEIYLLKQEKMYLQKILEETGYQITKSALILGINLS